MKLQALWFCSKDVSAHGRLAVRDRTLFLASMLAPRSSSTRAIEVRPRRLTTMRAVMPACDSTSSQSSCDHMPWGDEPVIDWVLGEPPCCFAERTSSKSSLILSRGTKRASHPCARSRFPHEILGLQVGAAAQQQIEHWNDATTRGGHECCFAALR